MLGSIFGYSSDDEGEPANKDEAECSRTLSPFSPLKHTGIVS